MFFENSDIAVGDKNLTLYNDNELSHNVRAMLLFQLELI